MFKSIFDDELRLIPEQSMMGDAARRLAQDILSRYPDLDPREVMGVFAECFTMEGARAIVMKRREKEK